MVMQLNGDVGSSGNDVPVLDDGAVGAIPGSLPVSSNASVKHSSGDHDGRSSSILLSPEFAMRLEAIREMGVEMALDAIIHLNHMLEASKGIAALAGGQVSAPEDRMFVLGRALWLSREELQRQIVGMLLSLDGVVPAVIERIAASQPLHATPSNMRDFAIERLLFLLEVLLTSAPDDRADRTMAVALDIWNLSEEDVADMRLATRIYQRKRAAQL